MRSLFAKTILLIAILVGFFAPASRAVASFCPSSLAAKTTGAADEMVDVYRVFGGDARAQGFSWTTVDPRTVSNFRNAAGLPSGGASGSMNTADFMIQGRASLKDVIKFKSADPLDGNIGGLRELIIDPKNVRRFQIVSE